MNIIRFLQENQRSVLETLRRVDADLAQPARARRGIERHIREYELYESLEESFLRGVRSVLGARSQGALQQFCGKWNGKVWALLEQWIQRLDDPRESRRAFQELAAFEELHFDLKSRALFPLIERALGREAAEALGRKAMQLYHRFYPTLAGGEPLSAGLPQGRPSPAAVPAGRFPGEGAPAPSGEALVWMGAILERRPLYTFFT